MPEKFVDNFFFGWDFFFDWNFLLGNKSKLIMSWFSQWHHTATKFSEDLGKKLLHNSPFNPYNYTQQKAAWLKGVQMTNCLKVKRTRLFWEVILLIWKNIVAFFPCFSKSKRDCECRCVEGKKVDEADLAPLLMCLKGRPGKAGLIWWHCKVDLLTLPNKYTLFIFNLFPWQQKSLLWSNQYFFCVP